MTSSRFFLSTLNYDARLSFLSLFLHITFLLSLSIVIFFFPTSLPKFYTSLFCFISQYEGHDSTFRASCSPPNCTHSLIGFDNTVTLTCRVQRQRSRRFKALLYRLRSISWIYLLLHFSNTSLSLPLFARSESVIRKPCLNIHVLISEQNHRRPNTSPLKNCYQILITQVSTGAVTTTATYGMRYHEVLQ